MFNRERSDSIRSGSVTKGEYTLGANLLSVAGVVAHYSGELVLWKSGVPEPQELWAGTFEGDPPAGVRESGIEASYELAYDDPETGEELVSFTFEDLRPLMPLLSDRIFEGAHDDRPSWIGWSADGVDWRWQETQTAFGLDSTARSAKLFIGRDVALAVISNGEGPNWFVADIPD